MNLMYLHRTGASVLTLGAGVTAARHSVSGRNYEGLLLPSGPAGEVRLASALRFHPFASRPIATDWLAVAGGSSVDLEIAFEDETGGTVSRVVDRIGAGPSVVSLPRLLRPSSVAGDRSLDLVLRNRAVDGSPITLLVVEVDSPGPSLSLAKGIGAQLLSGDETRLAPMPDREVFYVGTEAQIAASDATLPSSETGWAQALVGTPHDIPLVDAALDFMLARNVLQRAVNPLGHLAKWRTKLRPGGRVIAIVPYVTGGSDYLNMPTGMSDWLAEFEKGGFEETQAHHNAFARVRDLNPKSLFRRGFASSFSFFAPSNIADMLTFAVEHLGYEGLDIDHARNGRDIRFCLYA